MHRSAALILLAACSRSGGGAPPPEPEPADAVTLIDFAECGFSVESPGDPRTIGLELSCYDVPADVPVSPEEAWAVGLPQVWAKAGGSEVAPEPARKPQSIAGYPALGFRFAMTGTRSASGVLILVDHRIVMIWSTRLDDARLTAVIASFAVTGAAR